MEIQEAYGAERAVGARPWLERKFSGIWEMFFRWVAPARVREEAETPRGGSPLGEDFVRADGLAIHYANLYRSAFLVMYVLGAGAVTTALVGYGARTAGHPEWEQMCVVVEVAMVVGIFVIYWVATQGKWREKFTDYRLLGEQFRMFDFLVPLGVLMPEAANVDHAPEHGGEHWTAQHVRSRVEGKRGAILPDRPERWEFFQQTLNDHWITEQLRYHERMHERYKHLEHRLHWFASVMFLLSAVVVLGHFPATFALHHFWGTGAVERFEEMTPWLLLAAAGGPAWASAAHAILHHAEVRRMEMRSKGMVRKLKSLREQLAKRNLVLSELQGIAVAAARSMSDEVFDWHMNICVVEINFAV